MTSKRRLPALGGVCANEQVRARSRHGRPRLGVSRSLQAIEDASEAGNGGIEGIREWEGVRLRPQAMTTEGGGGEQRCEAGQGKAGQDKGSDVNIPICAKGT
jgi:hypothetical protein